MGKQMRRLPAGYYGIIFAVSLSKVQVKYTAWIDVAHLQFTRPSIISSENGLFLSHFF